MAYDSYTKLLLHCNGTDGSTTFVDEMGKTISVNGSAQIDTAQSKFGGASALFGTTSSDYIYTADSEDWNFGTGDFTIDFWIYLRSENNGDILRQYVDGNNQIYIYYDDDEGIIYRVVSGGTNLVDLTNPTADISINTWHHVAIVRYGSLWTEYLDGSSLKTATANITYPNYTGNLNIGGGGVQNKSKDCWIDEFRISKGIARWTSNFTPPTKEYEQEATTNYLGISRRDRITGPITGLSRNS